MKLQINRILMDIGVLICFLIIPAMFVVVEKGTKRLDNNYTDLKQIHELGKDEVIEQKIYVDNPIETLGIYVATGGERENSGSITVSIIGDEIIEEQVVDIEGIADWSEMKIPIKKNDIKNQWLTVMIQGSNVEQGNSIYFIFDNSVEGLEKARINGIIQEKSLCMKYTEKAFFGLGQNMIVVISVLVAIVYFGWYFYYNRKDKFKNVAIIILLLLETLFIQFYKTNVYPYHLGYINKLYIVVIGMLTIGILGVLYCLKKKIKIEWIAVGCIFIFGMVYLLILPACTAPDESTHFATAYKISNQLLFQQPTDSQGNVLVRQCDNIIEENVNKQLYAKLYENIGKSGNLDTTMVPLSKGRVINVSVIGHLPGAIGISIARILHLNSSFLIILGRMMGLLFYVFTIYWAIKKIPFGKMFLFVISMFPMMLEQISSYSYDLVINGLAFFIISYMLNLIYEKKKIQNKDIILMVGALFVFAPCKAIYFFIAGMWFLIPKEKFDNLKVQRMSNVIIPLSGIIPTIIWNLQSVISSATTSVTSWSSERSYTISDILSNIPHAIFVFINTLIEKLEFYLNSMIGHSLGAFNVPISSFIISGFIIIIILETFRKYDKYKIEQKDRVVYLSISVIVSCAVLAGMWISWTPISYNAIEGVQGRYFLPIVPLIYLAVANQEKIKIKSSVSMNVIMLCILNVYAVLDIFKVALER